MKSTNTDVIIPKIINSMSPMRYLMGHLEKSFVKINRNMVQGMFLLQIGNTAIDRKQTRSKNKRREHFGERKTIDF